MQKTYLRDLPLYYIKPAPVKGLNKTDLTPVLNFWLNISSSQFLETKVTELLFFLEDWKKQNMTKSRKRA